MIKFMLDTNICIYIIKQKPQNVIEGFQISKLKTGQKWNDEILIFEFA